MGVSYQIISFNPAIGQIQVQFKDNDVVVCTYSVDIPLDENKQYITGAELDNLLLGMFPYASLERVKTLEQGIANQADIEAMVVPLPLPPVTQIQPISSGLQTLNDPVVNAPTI